MSQLAIDFAGVEPPKARRTAALSSFHPTGQSPQEALEGEQRAARQEVRVAEWFRSMPAGHRATPWDVAASLGMCVNSARRSLTMLTLADVLEGHRDDRRAAGPYGQRSRTWSLRT